MTESKPEREPRALSTEYHKARKQLMLWAGILFIWELVGIDLEKAKEAGGNAGALISAIKSPQAVPWVLLILVAYFLFKVTVEWYQCNVARRSLRVSRIDFSSAWIMSLAAYALYIGQAISRVQFADVFVIEPTKRFSLIAGFNGGLILAFFAIIELRYRQGKRIAFLPRVVIYPLLVAVLLFVSGTIIIMVRTGLNLAFIMIGLVAGSTLWIPWEIFENKIDRRS